MRLLPGGMKCQRRNQNVASVSNLRTAKLEVERRSKQVRMIARRFCLVTWLFLNALGAACRPAADLRAGLQVEITSSGWVDVGVVDGKNKLVPTVSLKLKNVSARTLPVLQVNASFHRATDMGEWGSGYRMVVGSSGLASGAVTETLTITSQLGYTGTDSAADLLDNSRFVDATVDLFAKYGSSEWTPVGEYRVARQLIER
jgi:hypothetical protein